MSPLRVVMRLPQVVPGPIGYVLFGLAAYGTYKAGVRISKSKLAKWATTSK